MKKRSKTALKIYKATTHDTIYYTLVLSPTLHIKASILQEQDQDKNTIFVFDSVLIEGTHTPKGNPIDRSQFGKELVKFYNIDSIRNFHNAMPFLCKLVEGNDTTTPMPQVKKQTLLSNLRQRIRNLNLLRLEPSLT